MDIIELLQNPALEVSREEAANEIQRLRSALQSIADNTCCDGCQEAALVAKRALRTAKETPYRLPFHDETMAALKGLTIRSGSR
jgi:hypothetical protein